MPLPNDFKFIVATCIFEPLGDVVRRIAECLEMNHRSNWVVERGHLDVSRVYFPRPQSGSVEPVRLALWTPQNQPGTTAFLANLSDGWATLLARLSFEGMPDCVSIRSKAACERWFLQEIEYRYSGDETRRLLRLMDDGRGIEFFEDGTPLDAEDLSIPASERVADREALFGFAAKLGVNLADEGFWTADGDAVYFLEKRRGTREHITSAL